MMETVALTFLPKVNEETTQTAIMSVGGVDTLIHIYLEVNHQVVLTYGSSNEFLVCESPCIARACGLDSIPAFCYNK